MHENDVAKQIVDAAYRVHRTLGPGLLESAYEAALLFELKKRGLRVESQVVIPIVYEGVHIASGFRADVVVEDAVIVGIKSSEGTARVHLRQMLTYLRLSGKRLGLVINFNVRLIRDGISRVADGLVEGLTERLGEA